MVDLEANPIAKAEHSPFHRTVLGKTFKMTKKTKTKYKKAPQAPRRFKSAYMFFSTIKHREIREDLGSKGVAEKTTNIAKLVSVAWKELSNEEREKWEDMARKDKARFEVEKSLYTGPWKVPAKKRSQKDPNAPKRPMSAFLAYSHAKRSEVKKKSPNMNNAEISRELAQMWKDAADEEKKEYIEKEYELRQKYLSEIAVWRETTEKELSDQRKHREDIAMKTVDAQGTGEDVTASHQDGAPTQGYAGYYPPPHPYYAQGAYGQDYRNPYPPHYYPSHPSHGQYDPSQPETASEGFATDQYGYPPSHYGYYPPPHPSASSAYPPSHEHYPSASNGYGSGYAAEYPPHGGTGQSYAAAYYDQYPPREGETYDRGKFQHPADGGPPVGYHQAPYDGVVGAPDSKPAASEQDIRRAEDARQPHVAPLSGHHQR